MSIQTLGERLDHAIDHNKNHMLYEIEPDLYPSLPAYDNVKNDGMYNISNEYTMIQVSI